MHQNWEGCSKQKTKITRRNVISYCQFPSHFWSIDQQSLTLFECLIIMWARRGCQNAAMVHQLNHQKFGDVKWWQCLGSCTTIARQLVFEFEKDQRVLAQLLSGECFSSHLATALSVRESDFEFVMKSARFLKKCGDNFWFDGAAMKMWVVASNTLVQMTTFSYLGKTNIQCVLALGKQEELLDHPKFQKDGKTWFTADIWQHSKYFHVFVNLFDLAAKQHSITNADRANDKEKEEDNNAKMHHPDVSEMLMDRLRTCSLPVFCSQMMATKWNKTCIPMIFWGENLFASCFACRQWLQINNVNFCSNNFHSSVWQQFQQNWRTFCMTQSRTWIC